MFAVLKLCREVKKVEKKGKKGAISQASEVTSCIAEISSSLEVVVVAEHLYPSVELMSVDAELKRLQIELHEGALIPGILLPRLTPNTKPTKEVSSGIADILS